MRPTTRRRKRPDYATAALVSWVRQAALTGDARRLRCERQWTVAEVAGWLGVSQSQIAHWEIGRTRPNTANAIAWARLLRSDPLTGVTPSVADPDELAAIGRVIRTEPSDKALERARARRTGVPCSGRRPDGGPCGNEALPGKTTCSFHSAAHANGSQRAEKRPPQAAASSGPIASIPAVPDEERIAIHPSEGSDPNERSERAKA